MPFKATYTGFDGKKVILTDARGDWKLYTKSDPGLQNGDQVEFTYTEKQGDKGKYKILESITKVGAAGFATAGAAAPRLSAPAAAPSQNSERDEIIYVMGITNQYVGNTGDTSVKALVEVGLRAKEAFQVVFRGRSLGTVVPRDNPDPDQDRDAPF